MIGWLPELGDYESNCCESLHTGFCVSFLLGKDLGEGLLGHTVGIGLDLYETAKSYLVARLFFPVRYTAPVVLSPHQQARLGVFP